MMTEEQRRAWFTHHAPNPDTEPKYAAVRAAEQACGYAFGGAWAGSLDARAFDKINKGAEAFAVTVDQVASDGCDKDRAVAAIRLARNAANEALGALISSGGSAWDKELELRAIGLLRDARWAANSAIACGGV